MTVDEFLPLLDKSVDRELIRGRLREWPRRLHTPSHAETLTTFCCLLKSWEETRPAPRPCVHGFGAEYLAAGAVVWVVDTEFGIVTVLRPGHEPEPFSASQELSADPYLPGFRVAVAAIFDD